MWGILKRTRPWLCAGTGLTAALQPAEQRHWKRLPTNSGPALQRLRVERIRLDAQFCRGMPEQETIVCGQFESATAQNAGFCAHGLLGAETSGRGLGAHLVLDERLGVALCDEHEQSEGQRQRAADEAEGQADVREDAGEAVSDGAVRCPHHAAAVERAHRQQIQRLHSTRSTRRSPLRPPSRGTPGASGWQIVIGLYWECCTPHCGGLRPGYSTRA